MAIPVPSLFCKCKVARLFQNISALPVNIFAPLSYPRHFATLRLTCQQIAILAILPLLAGCSKMDPLWRIFPPRANRLLAHIWLAQHTNHPTITTHPLPSFFLLRSLISWVTRSCLFQRPSCNAHHGWPPSWHPVYLTFAFSAVYCLLLKLELGDHRILFLIFLVSKVITAMISVIKTIGTLITLTLRNNKNIPYTHVVDLNTVLVINFTINIWLLELRQQ